MTSSILKGVTILIVGVVQYKEEAELFKFRKLIVLSACAVLATGVVLFIIKVLMIVVLITNKSLCIRTTLLEVMWLMSQSSKCTKWFATLLTIQFTITKENQSWK